MNSLSNMGRVNMGSRPSRCTISLVIALQLYSYQYKIALLSGQRKTSRQQREEINRYLPLFNSAGAA